MENNFFTMLWKAFLHCLQGIPLTLELTAASVIAGFVLAIPLAMIHAQRDTWGAKIVRAYTYFFTGTPLLIQLYLFYKGMPEFGWVQDLMQKESWSFLKEGFFWAWLAFTLNTAAYSTEIFSGAIRNTPHGDIEAGEASGLTNRQIMSRIILPSSLRRALPAYSNEVIMMLQSTALASVVTLFEITGQALDFNTKYYQPFPAFISAAIIYLILTSLMVYAFRRLERKYLKHLALTH